MTPKQILDSFSETLVRDERILSAQERALVATLLRHAKTATVENQEIQEAVRVVIATAVGETVAQRAFAVLGGSIVDRILEGSTLSSDAANRTAEVLGPKDPEPPGVKVPPRPIRDIPRPPAPPDPEPPGVKKPGKPMRDTPVPDPEPP